MCLLFLCFLKHGDLSCLSLFIVSACGTISNLSRLCSALSYVLTVLYKFIDVLYSGRIGLGSWEGEEMNGVPPGFDWPEARIRLI